jgi:hypothetical protein
VGGLEQGKGSNVYVIRSRRDLWRVVTITEVGCVGRHSRRDGCRWQVDNEDGDGLGDDGNGHIAWNRWRDLVGCHRLRLCTRSVIVL